MPRAAYGTYQYAPTVGIRADLKRLMNQFISHNTVRYEQFSEVWRQKMMSFFFACRCSDRETREFIERVFEMAQEYFLPPFQFQVRVGGLYLLYALYETQPVIPKVKIRLTKSQWEDSLLLKQQAAQQSHLDVVFIFNKMLNLHAFHLCFTPVEVNYRLRHYNPNDDVVDLADQLKEEKSALNKLFNYESMEQLSYLQSQYYQMKVDLAGPSATKPDKSLDVMQGEIVEDLIVLLQNFREKVSGYYKFGKRHVPTTEDAEQGVSSTGNSRHTLKQRAYSQVVSASRKTHNVQLSDSDNNHPSPSKRSRRVDVSTESKENGSDHLAVVEENVDINSDNGSDDDYVPPGKQANRKKGDWRRKKHKLNRKEGISADSEPFVKRFKGEWSQLGTEKLFAATKPSLKRGRGRPKKVYSYDHAAALRKAFKEKRLKEGVAVDLDDSDCSSLIDVQRAEEIKTPSPPKPVSPPKYVPAIHKKNIHRISDSSSDGLEVITWPPRTKLRVRKKRIIPTKTTIEVVYPKAAVINPYPTRRLGLDESEIDILERVKLSYKGRCKQVLTDLTSEKDSLLTDLTSEKDSSSEEQATDHPAESGQRFAEAVKNMTEKARQRKSTAFAECLSQSKILEGPRHQEYIENQTSPQKMESYADEWGTITSASQTMNVYAKEIFSECTTSSNKNSLISQPYDSDSNRKQSTSSVITKVSNWRKPTGDILKKHVSEQNYHFQKQDISPRKRHTENRPSNFKQPVPFSDKKKQPKEKCRSIIEIRCSPSAKSDIVENNQHTAPMPTCPAGEKVSAKPHGIDTIMKQDSTLTFTPYEVNLHKLHKGHVIQEVGQQKVQAEVKTGPVVPKVLTGSIEGNRNEQVVPKVHKVIVQRKDPGKPLDMEAIKTLIQYKGLKTQDSIKPGKRTTTVTKVIEPTSVRKQHSTKPNEWSGNTNVKSKGVRIENPTSSLKQTARTKITEPQTKGIQNKKPALTGKSKGAQLQNPTGLMEQITDTSESVKTFSKSINVNTAKYKKKSEYLLMQQPIRLHELKAVPTTKIPKRFSREGIDLAEITQMIESEGYDSARKVIDNLPTEQRQKILGIAPIKEKPKPVEEPTGFDLLFNDNFMYSDPDDSDSSTSPVVNKGRKTRVMSVVSGKGKAIPDYVILQRELSKEFHPDGSRDKKHGFTFI